MEPPVAPRRPLPSAFAADNSEEAIANSLDIPTEAELEEWFPNRPRNKNETPPFHVLYTTLFEPLLDNRKKRTGVGLRGARVFKPHEARRHVIDNFISRWRSEVGHDIFPAFRLILSNIDRDRNVFVDPGVPPVTKLTVCRSYNLKEQKIAKLLVKVLKINKDSDDGYALLHWKQPGFRVKSAGDFPLRCYGWFCPLSSFRRPADDSGAGVQMSSRNVPCAPPPEISQSPKSTTCWTVSLGLAGSESVNFPAAGSQCF